MRDQAKSLSSGTGNRPAAFTGMTVAETVEPVIDEEGGPREHAVAFTVQACRVVDPQAFLCRAKSVLPQINDNLKGNKKYGENPFHVKLQPMAHRFCSLIRPTTSESRDTMKSNIVLSP